MKTRTFTALVAMALTMASLASMASAQTIIRDSGNGTGNSISAGGGFGPTEIRNSGNGDFNTIDARPTWGHTVTNSHTVAPQSYHRTYTVRRQVYPSYTTVPHSYHSVPGYQALPKVRYVPATRPARYVEPVRVEPVPHTVPRPAPLVRTWTGGTVIRDTTSAARPHPDERPLSMFSWMNPKVPHAVPRPAPPVRTWTGGTVIRDSGNGTGNTINARGGFGASVIDSGNGENNMINIGY